MGKMSNCEPDSLRTQLYVEAYQAGFTEKPGPLSRQELRDVSRAFTYGRLGDHPPGWKFNIVLRAFERGWYDHKNRKPCQPCPRKVRP